MQKKGRDRELDKIEHFKVKKRIARQNVPGGKKVIPVLWYEKMKNGEIRSRLCVRDVARTISKEYFAATPTPAALRLILALADAMGLSIQTADLDTAFMHAPLKEPEYCEACEEDYDRMAKEQPELKNVDYVWELHQAMNGLRKSPKACQEWFAKVLVSVGFTMLPAVATATPLVRSRPGLSKVPP